MPQAATDRHGDLPIANRVRYRADLRNNGVVVAITVFADRYGKYTWFPASKAVTPSLITGPPPAWVPPAPGWFDAIVAQMQYQHRTGQVRQPNFAAHEPMSPARRSALVDGRVTHIAQAPPRRAQTS